MSNKRILYISDLDGTLLRKDRTVSPFTAETVGKLIEKGMLFSYATARSYATASKVTENLQFHIPVIVFNGTFIVEPNTRKRLRSNVFTPEETALIRDVLTEHRIFPVVNAFFGDWEKFSYIQGKETRGIHDFVEERKDDSRRCPVSNVNELYDGDVFHVACIDVAEKLRPAYEYLKEDLPCVLYRDIYGGETWLEIHPKGATKASALLTLKAMLNCDKIICFGDGRNDIPMFEIADECYAVENADPDLKSIATDVIESNEADGVAKWLFANAKFERF